MADATDILSAVKTALEALYPDVPVRVSKRGATDGRNLRAGWQSGYPAPCFVVSCDGAEEVDRRPSFRYVSVGYPVLIEYVKPAQAKVPGALDAGAPAVVEDPDVRAKRAALRGALYKPTLAGAPAVYDVRHQARPVYEQVTDSGATLLVSGEQFVWTATEPRPH
ncbi:MAG TPA: hypothetical protein VGE74_05025 [Gemmata sp.]